MRLKTPRTMAAAIEQLVIDPQSRFLEMKSLQPYSTTDEYLYAMKEDLADWLSNMYPEWRPITAENFLSCLENGVLLCQHANNVNNAARRAYALKLAPQPWRTTLENCKYRSDARPQTFNARDNVSQFIKWARRVVGVREVLMFESDDIILRKNEKNFLLCLLEIARYGAQFGVSVPAIIQLEDEIEREIQRDKQSEIMSFTELRRLQREENQKTLSISPTHGKYSKLLKLVRSENFDSHHEPSKNSYNTFSLSHSNGASWLRQRISRIPKFTSNYGKKRQSSGESNDSTTCSDVTTTIMSTKEQQIPHVSRTLGEGENRTETPTVSSQLHKTVVQMTNSCCCDQRFPVIRIGEGKYRIGEGGTIIFIRILRYHVMVRVGGGWDTLENYLNKHDPCRRSGNHRRLDLNDHRKDIPILAIPNGNVSSSCQKSTPYGKAVTIKTEDFPLTKPTNHDTNLSDAQLIITRDADGRHHIGQITYKSEEDLTLSRSCPHHHHQQQQQHQVNPPSPAPKIKSVRGTGRLVSPSIYRKLSPPNMDQDYSSYTPSSSIDTRSYTISANEVRSLKTESFVPHRSRPKLSNDTFKENKPMPRSKSAFSEVMINDIDGYRTPTFLESEHDFDISDIGDALRIHHNEDDPTNMDEDSLESCEGVLEPKKKSTPPIPIHSNNQPTVTNVKSGGVCTALYFAQKQRRATITQNPLSPLSYARSNTLPDVIEAMKKEEAAAAAEKIAQKSTTTNTRRSKSIELLERNPLNDMSKLDRDSGFDEQDFRCERLQSSYDDNSSISSLKSARSSTGRSLSSDLNGQIYRENKAYELRLKALDHTRIQHEQLAQDWKFHPHRNLQLRSNEPSSTTHKYRKNTPQNYYLKHQ